MILPVQVTFRNVDPAKEIEEDIRARAEKLEKFYSPITSCRVLVEAPERHRQKGHLFRISVDLTVPEGEIVIKRAPTLYSRERDMGDERSRKGMETGSERKYLKVAIRESFDAARRKLQDQARRRRLDVKKHEGTPEARVTKLFPNQDYGCIETADGREIYFHAHSVINGRFKDLKLGAKVRFAEEAGEKGPQASTVRLIKKARTATLPPARAGSSRQTTK
jgi:cold shock CspA family protein